MRRILLVYYQQIHGAAMGSSISPVVGNMKYFEDKAIATALTPPFMWLRYVLHEYDVEIITNHINSIDNNIKFTTETKRDRKCLSTTGACTSTKISLQRKPPHTGQYLNFKSYHPLIQKLSVVRTLTNRATQYVINSKDKEDQIQHVPAALKANNIPAQTSIQK